MFSPDLRPVGSIDNLESNVRTTFEKEVTTGFTFTSSQTISSSFTVKGTVGVATLSGTIGFSLEFSETWEKSSTITTSFSCPPESRAFLYQGTLKARRLILNSTTGKLSWGAEAHFLTETLTTAQKPLKETKPLAT